MSDQTATSSPSEPTTPVVPVVDMYKTSHILRIPLKEDAKEYYDFFTFGVRKAGAIIKWFSYIEKFYLEYKDKDKEENKPS